jgi:hypothetical protein
MIKAQVARILIGPLCRTRMKWFQRFILAQTALFLLHYVCKIHSWTLQYAQHVLAFGDNAQLEQSGSCTV